jgi:biopolymer transport protein ExbB
MTPDRPTLPTGAFRRYVLPLLREKRAPIVLAFVLVGISGGAAAMQNVFPKWLFSYVLQPPGLGGSERWWRFGELALIFLFLTAVLRMLFWHWGYRLFTRAREHIVFALRRRFFRHVNHLCLRFHGEHNSGELFSYLFGSPLRAVIDFFQHTTMNVPGSAVALVSTMVVFLVWDPVLAGILFATTLFSVIMMLRARRRMQRIQSDFQAVEGDVSGRVADLLRGNKAVKLHAMEAQVARSFEEEADTGAAAAQEALPPIRPEATLWQVLVSGGPVMIPLGILSVIAVMLVLVYLFTLRRGAVVTKRYMTTADALLRKRDYLGLLAISNRHRESVARIMQRTLDFITQHPEATFAEAREIAETEGTRQAAALNQRITYLADIGTIAPMLGLFGTVLGMIKAFSVVASDIVASRPIMLAEGVSEALVTTATGLVIGIPAMAAYAFFRGRVQSLIAELEAASTQLIALLSVAFTKKH